MADRGGGSLADPFWHAAARHRLAIQRCSRCERYSHPPVPECRSCGSLDLRWQEVSGQGTVFATAVVHGPRGPGLGAPGPLIGVAVELREQPGLLVVSHLVDAPAEGGWIGLEVEATFQEDAAGQVLPFFRPVRTARPL